MSNKNNNGPKVEVVLPTPVVDNNNITVDPKTQKENLKNKISNIKQVQKQAANDLKAAQKELNKLSASSKKKKVQKKATKEAEIVKKGKNNKGK